MHPDQSALPDALASCYERWRNDQRPQPPALAAMLHRLSLHAHERLSTYELALCHKCKQHCDRSRRLAETDEEGEACHAMAVAQSVARSGVLSKEASLLCWAEIEPAEAHIERLAGNWSGAHTHFENSLALDETLETSFGYHEKIAHRVHMLTVRMMLLAAQGRYAEAASSAGRYLRYLDGSDAVLSDPGDWSKARLRSLPEGMTSVLATHVITSLTAILVCQHTSERERTIAALTDVVEASSQTALPRSPATSEACGFAKWLMRSPELGHTGTSGYAFGLLHRQLELSRGTSLFHLLAFDAACLFSDRALATKIARHVAARPWWSSLRGHWRKRLPTSFTRRELRVHSAVQVSHSA